MMKDRYKYDTAFSFLQKDEQLAIQLNDLLKERIKTFIYTQNQKEIAGRDGEKVFNKVFGQEARIVVIIYRKGWGETSWTRIEETAIKNRAYKKGYDFVVVIPSDKQQVTPEWLPKTIIYVGLDRWGLEGAVGAIELKVQEFGGSPKEESIEEYAIRVNEKLTSDAERETFFNSYEGVRVARGEFSELYDELTNCAESKKLRDAGFDFNLGKKPDNVCFAVTMGAKIEFDLEIIHNNLLKDSYLEASILKLTWHWNPDPKTFYTSRFVFDIDNIGKYGWRQTTGENRFFTSKQLAENLVRRFLKLVEEKVIQ